MERGKLFYISRFFVRLGIGRWSADVPAPEGPTVYVCSHSDLLGPLATLCWLPFAPRPWVLHVFLDRENCRKQYRDYTFSRRFGMPGPLAALAAFVLKAPAAAVVAIVKTTIALEAIVGIIRVLSMRWIRDLTQHQ